MITCDFYLNNRIKTITGENIKACWNTFRKDFGEAISELCKVKVYWEVLDSYKTHNHILNCTLDKLFDDLEYCNSFIRPLLNCMDQEYFYLAGFILYSLTFHFRLKS